MRASLSRKGSNSGFTLIELIVVMVILGILAVTAIPKYIDLQSEARISYLQSLKGAIQSANQMLHSYATIHGMDSMNLDEPGTTFDQAAVFFDGNKIKKADPNDKQEPHLVFLNYGYVAIIAKGTRNASLVHIIGRDTIDSTKYGFSKSVESLNIKNDNDLKKKKCESSDSRVDICYIAYDSGSKFRTDAYIVPIGFTPSECSLHYHAAVKDSKGVITPPVITLTTSGC